MPIYVFIYLLLCWQAVRRAWHHVVIKTSVYPKGRLLQEDDHERRCDSIDLVLAGFARMRERSAPSNSTAIAANRTADPGLLGKQPG